MEYFTTEQGHGSHTKPTGWETAAGTQESIVVTQGFSVTLSETL